MILYQNISQGEFVDRPNRFIAHVKRGGEELTCHVKNTGRCRELLLPGGKVYLEESSNPARKTRFDLVAVEKRRENASPLLINMDSQAPNAVAEEFLLSSSLFPGEKIVKREVTFGESRFDFHVRTPEEEWFIEVKGVTLENGGVASFPDAPTLRGRKHLLELVNVVKSGKKAMVLFVIQMKECHTFTPNFERDEAFAQTLAFAREHGVKLLAMDCLVTPESMTIDKEVPVKLQIVPCNHGF